MTRPRGKRRRCLNCGRELEFIGGRLLMRDTITLRIVLEANEPQWTALEHRDTTCHGLRISPPPVP